VSIHACPPRSGLPEAVPAVPEFCDAALAVNPHQVGKPLPGPLAGRHGARHGTYPGIEVDTARCVPQITATIIASGRF